MQNWEKKESPILPCLDLVVEPEPLSAVLVVTILVSGGNSYHEDSTYSWFIFTSRKSCGC